MHDHTSYRVTAHGIDQGRQADFSTRAIPDRPHERAAHCRRQVAKHMLHPRARWCWRPGRHGVSAWPAAITAFSARMLCGRGMATMVISTICLLPCSPVRADVRRTSRAASRSTRPVLRPAEAATTWWCPARGPPIQNREARERKPVAYLILRVPVGEGVERLQDQCFKITNSSHGLRPTALLRVLSKPQRRSSKPRAVRMKNKPGMSPFPARIVRSSKPAWI